MSNGCICWGKYGKLRWTCGSDSGVKNVGPGGMTTNWILLSFHVVAVWGVRCGLYRACMGLCSLVCYSFRSVELCGVRVRVCVEMEEGGGAKSAYEDKGLIVFIL